MKHPFLVLAGVSLLLSACTQSPIDPNEQYVTPIKGLHGMYLLNEGGYNMNNASLDYLDFETGLYTLNRFTSVNPTIIQGLGDVGNDILVYGAKTYIVVNGSNLVEVIHTHSAQHLAAITIPNGRRLCAGNGAIYVTSYAGRVIDTQHQLGNVLRIDTTSLTVTDTCEVGYQPEGMAIVGNNLYVANSGGYVGMNTGQYDNRLSVIDLSTFTLTKHLTIAPNLQDLLVDSRNTLWIASSGNYNDTVSNLYSLDATASSPTITSHGIGVTKMVMSNDTLLFYNTTYDANWNPTTEFFRLATATDQLLPLSLSLSLTQPYAITVNPVSHQIYVADAGDYVNPGTLHCFTPTGTHVWQLRTGVVPGHFAFVLN